MQTDIASYIDHTLLKPTVTYNEVEKLCEEAVQFGFAAVCIPPASVLWAGLCLDGSAVKLATVIGFPFGYSALEAKLAEIEQAVEDGSDELDVVINLIALKNGNWAYLETEMAEICALAKSQHQRVKAIIETGVLTPGEIIRCCELYPRTGVDFLKTSTGYAERGATVETVQLMRSRLPSSVQVKASGGIRTLGFAVELIQAGATRLGCSASVAIMQDLMAENQH